MAKQTSKNIRLGIFVMAGTVFLVAALYLIGAKQNFFGSTFRISARFHNVNGLMAGNNVRFAGIDVGTVKSVEILNDSSVNVTMVIENDARKFIRKNAIASVGTDGLMGNKIVNINSGKETAPVIEEGDVLKTLKSVETDEVIRTLNRTNENVSVITENLRKITEKVNSPNTIWSLLMDTLVAQNVKQTIVNIKLVSSNTALVSGDLKKILGGVRSGKGTIGALLTDDTIPGRIRQTVVKISAVGDSMAMITGDLREISKKLRNGQGTAGTLLMDTMVVYNLNKSLENIKNGSGKFSDDMEALKLSWPFRKYFRKLEKKQKGKK